MANDHLILRIPDTDTTVQQEVEWLLYSPAAELLGAGSHPLMKLTQHLSLLSENYRIHVIVPGQLILFTEVVSPARNQRQLKQTLPFLVEELIAEEIEKVHMALPDVIPQAGERLHVAVIKHELLINWLDCLYHSGLAPQDMLVDGLCVPWQSSQWSLVLESEQRTILRTGQYGCYVSCGTDVKLLLTSLLQSAANSSLKQKIKIYYADESGMGAQARTLRDWLETHYADTEVELSYFDEPLFNVLSAVALNQAVASTRVNLLQGGYSPETKSGENPWRVFAAPLKVAGAMLAVYMVFLLSSGWYFQRQASVMEARAASIYREVYPNSGRVISPKKQMQIRLQGMQQGNGDRFLALLGMSADQLRSAGGDGFSIQQLRFNSDGGALQLQVTARSIGDLEQFKQTLSQRSLAVSIRSAVENSDSVDARIEVQQL